jgi:hypothetical protein
MKHLRMMAIVVSFVVLAAIGATAQDNSSPQSQVASKKAKFDTINASDPVLKTAIDAHDLSKAAGLIGKTGSFKGTVDRLYAPKGGSLVIFNFDRDYKTALTAIVRKGDFSKFPDLTKLEGKQVLITGKFIDYKGAAEIELTDPNQIKLID